MDPSVIQRAADLFVQARRSGVPIAHWPAECKPANAAEVNAIVDAVTRRLVDECGETIGGWKIGFLYSPRQEPMLCPLFNSRLFASPARVPLSLTSACCIEPEIAFRLQADLPPRARPYRAAEVAEVVVACASLELIDTRFPSGYRAIRGMIDDRSTRLDAFADHNTTGAYVTAAGRGDWQDFDFAAMRMVMRTPGRVIVETIGGHAFSDPFLPCVVLANRMRQRGGLRAGQLLVTGSFCGFFEVRSDEPVTAEFEGFGVAVATFAST